MQAQQVVSAVWAASLLALLVRSYLEYSILSFPNRSNLLWLCIRTAEWKYQANPHVSPSYPHPPPYLPMINLFSRC